MFNHLSDYDYRDLLLAIMEMVSSTQSKPGTGLCACNSSYQEKSGGYLGSGSSMIKALAY